MTKSTKNQRKVRDINGKWTIDQDIKSAVCRIMAGDVPVAYIGINCHNYTDDELRAFLIAAYKMAHAEEMFDMLLGAAPDMFPDQGSKAYSLIASIEEGETVACGTSV